MKKGEATGPQKRTRRSAPEEQDEATREVDRRDDDARARSAWDSTLQRAAEEAQRILTALEGLPAGSASAIPAELPLQQLREVEHKLNELRVVLEQAGDTAL